MDPAVRVTPFWEQYCRLKAQHPDAILWTRMGDFYEMFEEDARVAARELHITLTSREFGKDFRVPLAGVPYHAAESYLARLIRKGFHVAICEQVSEAGHGLVEREVLRVVTPGTLTEPALLPQRSNNYLAALLWTDAAGGLAYVDVSTGEFYLVQFDGDAATAMLEAELRRLAPAECLTPRDQAEPFDVPGHRTVREPWQFEEGGAREQLALQFHTQSLAAFGCDGRPLATACAGAVLRYLGQTNPALLPLLTSLRGYAPGSYMQLDGQSRRNLNLTRGAYGSQEGSLLATLDCTQSAIGARLLRRQLGQPLLDVVGIVARQDIVAALLDDRMLRAELRRLLSRVLDIERTSSRMHSGSATPREVWVLGQSLKVARAMQRLAACASPTLQTMLRPLDGCDDLAALINGALTEPGAGKTIADGHSDELDALRASSNADRAWMGELEVRERTRTGIRSLKVAVNKVFGYYIEVTNPNRALVPLEYVRKQTVAGAERYVTPELKDVEARLLRADDDLEALESRLFVNLLRRLARHADRLHATAQRIAELDVACALAEIADQERWVRPSVDESTALDIVNGRHPVVERAIGAEGFIPNDCHLGADGPQALLITGPNMAGKSTYLRQVALIALLAQIGSYVPAEAARIGLVDRIFTRVGAHDDLAGGASTFMMEMMETATICRQATARSLIVLDEVGRGTSTEDGSALAQAVLEHLHDHVQARTLFATHFRSLVQDVEHLPRLAPYTFAVLELSGQVAFTHRIASGVADRSYGLHVARLAGVPENIVLRAQALLDAAVTGQGRDCGPGGHPRPGYGERLRSLDTEASDGTRDRSRSGTLATDPSSGSAHSYAPPVVEAGETPALPATLPEALPIPGHLSALLRELEQLDLVQTTPLQALVKLADVQQAARRLLDR
ncbi:MAG: DNA mismatch repair protein MutS [Chloroflexota bacterium]